ncbi:hypothetical protein Cantr_00060 [Candida viswanathii]|uniref:Zn(2)-C6 fungal-type domain-containing protein n=1 Tax=Candida viswanathii TaxID=5486 RepID=A0A367YFZ9_9ASCO|nr:hypothetical protein Cantr_00060 [Candida viswanathii]
MTTITGADGTNKIIPERTRTCSNCRFLDIECVFVQSNRGGKRKKRNPDISDPDLKKLKSLHLNLQDPNQQDTDGGDVSSSTERVSSYISDGHVPKKLPSPVFSQATMDFQRMDPRIDQLPWSSSSSTTATATGPTTTRLIQFK